MQPLNNSQTAWWYQRFLLDFFPAATSSSPADDAGDGEENVKINEMWDNHLQNLRELVVDEPNCKWALIGLLRVLQCAKNNHNDDSDGDATREEDVESIEIMNKLTSIDPDINEEKYRHMIVNQSL